MEDAIVIAAEVAPGTGTLAGEPVTRATLRDASGRVHVVRIVGGPTARGGYARLAGFVVPLVGARVALDLRDHPPVSSPLPVSPLLPVPPLPLFTRWAPNTPAGTWDATKLPLALVLALPQSRDLGADAAAELDVAARTWGRPACTSFRARFDRVAPLISGDDGVSGVFFDDVAWPPELVEGALAQTIVHVDASGKLRDADIHVNGAAHRFSRDGAPGTQDLQSVLVHEIGHALGLGHSSDARATMNLSGSGLRWRSLEKDDVDGVCALYPGIGSAGCDAEPCPSGFMCVAATCQRAGDRADVCSPCTLDGAAPGACEAAGDGARCVDIGQGPTAGRVCGRACAIDADCGSGFACRPTTEAGDLQCLSLVDCRNGASPCATNADCTHPGASCRGGACVGERVDPGDAGAPDDATADAGPRPTPLDAGGGCDCGTAPGARSAPRVSLALLALLVAAVLRRRVDRLHSARARSSAPRT